MSESIYHKCDNCMTIYYASWDDIDCPFCNGDEEIGQGFALFKEILAEGQMSNLGAVIGLLELYTPENIVDFCIKKEGYK